MLKKYLQWRKHPRHLTRSYKQRSTLKACAYTREMCPQTHNSCWTPHKKNKVLPWWEKYISVYVWAFMLLFVIFKHLQEFVSLYSLVKVSRLPRHDTKYLHIQNIYDHHQQIQRYIWHRVPLLHLHSSHWTRATEEWPTFMLLIVNIIIYYAFTTR